MHAQHRNHELFLDSCAMLSGKTHFEQRTTCETELISRITIRIALGNVIPDENNWLFRSLSKTQFIYTGLYCLYGKHILVEDNIFCVEDSAFGFIRMKNGAVIELESAWALNTLEVDEAKTSLCGTKAGADMKDGLRINYIHHNTQVVEKPELSSGGVAFFSGKEKSAADYEQELFYHIVVDGAEQVVKPAQAAVVTRILEAVYRSAESGETIYFD